MSDETRPSDRESPRRGTLTGAGRTREEQALAELGHTKCSTGVAWALTAVFLATILAVPAIQTWAELQRSTVAQAGPRRGVGPLIVRAALPGFGLGVVTRMRRLFAYVPAEPQLRRIETSLERRSIVGRFIRSHAQLLLTGSFEVGNDSVYVGNEGWLFYRTGIDYITGPGFLSPEFLKRRRATARSTDPVQQPDPRPSILRFRDQLERRGITLVLFPAPDKVMLYPDRFHGAPERWTALPQNPSYEAFADELRAQRVHVFNPSAALFAERRGSHPLFLQADTHWMPTVVESVARDLAREIRRVVPLPAPIPDKYEARNVDLSLLQFDLVNLLQLPPDQRLFAPLTVKVRQIVDREGELWRGEPAADVLVVGDSFCMMYSTDQALRPLAGGLTEQLAYELGRPLDKVCVAGGGSYLSRQILANDIAAGARRLASTKVVVWQFAIRDLGWGDWRLIDLPEP